ncbi:hypothetical protein EHO62_05510 [Leptospira kmetyi]|nr:hypothetical protein EHO62_05510 [Leptospira kmetyi]TGK34856.1 hypothetical protein EHO66_00060 [Leptospira kmetyi]
MNSSEYLSFDNFGGRGRGRPVYEIIYNGQKQTVGVTIGSNGFIVGANPVSSYRPLSVFLCYQV